MNLSRRGFLGGGTAFFLAGCRTYDWFGAPELRFGVVSDIHVTTPKSTALFRKALRYFKGRGVDAVMVPGDLTDWGLRSGYRYVAEAWAEVFGGRETVPLFCTGNHDWDGWRYGDMTMEMHANGYSEDDHNTAFGMEKCWREAFGEPFAPIRVRTVKGYDFVSSEWRGFADFPEWMAKNGARFRGKRPFFYFQHPPAQGTTSDSAGWADKGAAFKALKDFPNAIAFTGHTHRPFNDERSIWQGEFTAIATPSLSYQCFPSGYENGGSRRNGTSEQAMPYLAMRRDLRGGEGYFVSVYPDKMVVERIDIEEDCAEGAPAWVVPLGTAERPLDLARRTAASRAPEFPEGAAVDVETRNTENRSDRWIIVMNCEFPAAVPEPDARVWDYEIRAVFADGTAPVVKKFLSPAFAYTAAHEPERMRFWFDVKELPEDKEFHLEVRASNCFGKTSRPIRSKAMRTSPGYEKVRHLCVVLGFDANDTAAKDVLVRHGLAEAYGTGPLPKVCPVEIGPDMTAAAFGAKLDTLIRGPEKAAELLFRGVPASRLEELMTAIDVRREQDWIDVTTHELYNKWFGGR